MCDLPPMVARSEGFHQQEVRLHHSRDIYQSLRRWGIGIAPWHQLPSRIGPRLRQWPGFFFQSRERARNDKSLDRIYGFAMTSTRFRDYMLRAMSCERMAGVVMDDSRAAIGTWSGLHHRCFYLIRLATMLPVAAVGESSSNQRRHGQFLCCCKE
jgi:hypothetical protein